MRTNAGSANGWAILNGTGIGFAPTYAETILEGIVALDIAPRVVVMDRGHIVYDGPSETLRKDPAKLEQLIGVVKA